MRRPYLLLVIALTCSPWLQASEVYRSEGADGVPVFSDQPQDGAQPMELPETSSYQSPSYPAFSAPTTDEPPTEKPFEYRLIEVAAPGDDETIWDDEGRVQVRLRLEPALEGALGHQVEIVLDGVSVHTGTAITYPLKGLDRGAHTLQANVLDKAGEVMIASPSVAFFVHRPSVNLPNRRPPPKPAKP